MSSHQEKPEADFPALLVGLGLALIAVEAVGVGVPKIITRTVSTRLGVAETRPGTKAAVGVGRQKDFRLRERCGWQDEAAAPALPAARQWRYGSIC